MLKITRRRRFASIVTAGIACVSLLSVVVFALEEEQTIHILPTVVDGEGWEQSERAMEQTLGPNATFADFALENATYVMFPEERVFGSKNAGQDTRQDAWGPEPSPVEEVQEGVAPSDDIP